MTGSGIEIKFSEDWLMDMIRGKPGGKTKLKNALKQSMLKAGKAMQANFVTTLRQGKIKKRTGELEKSFLAPGALTIVGNRILFGSDNPAAWSLEKGMRSVKPKNSKYLAFPLKKYRLQREYQGNHPARKFFQKFGNDAVFIPPGGKPKAGIYLKRGKKRLQKHFHVARQTKVPKLLNFEKTTNAFWKNQGMKVVEDGLISKLGL